MDIKTLIRKTPLYRNTYDTINKFSEEHFTKFIKTALKDVPYYKKRFKIDTKYSELPILRKGDIVDCEGEFISGKYPKFLLQKKSTGGTSGISLNIYRNFKDIAREVAFVDFAFRKIGTNLKIAELRGKKPKNGIYELKNNRLLLSSYLLQESNVHEYVKYLVKFNTDCLHAFPSTLMIFIKLLESRGLQQKLRHIRGIVTSSEILSLSDKRYILKVLPQIKLVDIYGQNEHVAFAISEGIEPYKFYLSYGYTEFSEIKRAANGHCIAEIISTGLGNNAMPLLKYGTEDYVEIDHEQNIISIFGRSQDFLYDKSNEKVPCTVLTRDDTLKNVLSFQFYQDTPGIVEFHVITNSDFSEKDTQNIQLDFEATFGNRLKSVIKTVSSLKQSTAGKTIRLISKL